MSGVEKKNNQKGFIMIEKKKIVRIAMRITEAIINILKEELGESDENGEKETKKVR